MIKTLDSGSHQVIYYVNRIKKKKTFKSLKVARDFEAKMRIDKERELVYGRDNKVLIKDLIDDFLTLKKKKASSVDRDKLSLRHIEDYLNDKGVLSVNNLSKDLLRRYEVTRRDKVKQRTINLETGALIAVLNFALRNDRIASNPLAFYEKPKTTPKFKRYLTEQEIELIYHQLPDQISKDIFYTLITLGLRSSELCHLKYSDYKDGVLHLAQKEIDDEEWSPKWHMERFVHVRHGYISDSRIERILSTTTNGADNYVFLNKLRVRFDRNHLYRKFKRLFLEMKGLKNPNELNLHTCRHTHITYAVARGINIRTIMENVGINDYKTFMRYSKAVVGLRENLIDKNCFFWQRLFSDNP